MPLQITPFYAKQTQFPKKSNDVNPYNTTDYERKRNWTLGENKPNSNPIKANLKRAKMNINSIITKDYRKKDDFEVRINKPNFRKAQNERKLICSKGLQKKMISQSKKTNPTCSELVEPIQTQSKPVLSAVEWANFRILPKVSGKLILLIKGQGLICL